MTEPCLEERCPGGVAYIQRLQDKGLHCIHRTAPTTGFGGEFAPICGANCPRCHKPATKLCPTCNKVLCSCTTDGCCGVFLDANEMGEYKVEKQKPVQKGPRKELGVNEVLDGTLYDTGGSPSDVAHHPQFFDPFVREQAQLKLQDRKIDICIRHALPETGIEELDLLLAKVQRRDMAVKMYAHGDSPHRDILMNTADQLLAALDRNDPNFSPKSPK